MFKSLLIFNSNLKRKHYLLAMKLSAFMKISLQKYFHKYENSFESDRLRMVKFLQGQYLLSNSETVHTRKDNRIL